MKHDQPLLSVSGLHASYDGNEILHGVSFFARKGEFVAIAGPNGAGKSTLLRTIAGLKPPTGGSIAFRERALAEYTSRQIARRIAVVFQDSARLYDFTVLDLVSLGRSPFLSRWKPLSPDDWAIIEETLEMTEISQLRHRLLYELSGGERQRAVIAQALAQRPSLLLLDEPSTHLDLHHQVGIFQILDQINRERGVTILCITHDLTLAAQFVDRFVLMSGGQILADGRPEEVIERNTMESLFNIPACVGNLPETNTRFVAAVRNHTR